MIDSLKDIPLFSCLDDAEIEALREVARNKTFPKGTMLFSEGDESDNFYVICSGKVNVGKNDEEGREIILTMLGPGEYFGEMALMDGEPRSAFVMTKEATELLVITKKDFNNLLLANPGIMFNFLIGLQKRLREANKRLESLALMDVYGRVARLLTYLAGSSEPGSVVEDKLTHQEIASMVGASREMVSRVLKDLTTQGYISIRKKRVTIHKHMPYEW
jgi:CRP/FNR family cyclic AMP-dependent transcriptional regulator